MSVRPLDTLLAFKVINLMPNLRQSDRRVGAALIEHFNRRSGRCDPSLKRMASLLGYCERTIIRSTQKLQSVGLFRKVRHGGYSNRNNYEPNWSRFAELHAAWKAELHRRSRSAPTYVSPSTGQRSHLAGDSHVTQTCIVNNLPNETCCKGHPRKEKDQAVRTPGRSVLKTMGGRSADAARNEAERRWHNELLRRYSTLPVTYAEIIEAIDESIRTAATDAELQCRGAGFAYIVKQLKLR